MHDVRALAQAFGQFLDRIVSGHDQLLLHRRGLDQVDEIAPRRNGDNDIRDVDAEDILHAPRLTDTVDLALHVVEPLEGDDQLKVLFAANRTNAEHARDVHDADAADLHEPGRCGRGGAEQDVVADILADAREVVRHQRATTLDETERGLGLAEAWIALEEDAEPADLDHRPVNGCRRRAELLEDERAVVHEGTRRHRRRQQDRARLHGKRGFTRLRLTAAGEDEAKRLPVKERLHPLVARHVVKRIEIGHLGVAENLQPIPGEVLVEARERQAGTVDDRFLDLPVQVFRARNEREGQRFAAGFVEVGHGEGVALRARTGRKTLHDQFFADAARCLRTVPLRALTRILRS